MEHLIICHNGALPINFFPESEDEDKKVIETSLVEENIHLKKQIKSLMERIKKVEKERDTYKLYVPQELLSMANLIGIKNKKQF